MSSCLTGSVLHREEQVTVSSPVSSLVMLIVGPFIGIILILLLVLWRYRRSIDLSCIREQQSELHHKPD
ncbi:hypothetical protein ILYODFUR_039127 [Ilyodon furcidens]|uniref:Uncharacterized protein n=1 Tax=Ilyodon furcidens TaxID=33524 RepID=A0ABV0TET5_9TELE